MTKCSRLNVLKYLYQWTSVSIDHEFYIILNLRKKETKTTLFDTKEISSSVKYMTFIYFLNTQLFYHKFQNLVGLSVGTLKE